MATGGYGLFFNPGTLVPAVPPTPHQLRAQRKVFLAHLRAKMRFSSGEEMGSKRIVFYPFYAEFFRSRVVPL
jgi:hypothetical protein